MLSISLEEIKKHMTEPSWILLESIQQHPMLSKKELMQLNEDLKKHKFEQAYLKLLSCLLIEEIVSDQDQRSFKVKITDYGTYLIKIKGENQ